MKRVFAICVLSYAFNCYGQSYSTQDSLRGSIGEERAWWDLIYYHLDIEVLPDEKKLIGSNTIVYEVLNSHNVIQVDLQKPLKITRIEQGGQQLDFSSDGNAHFALLNEEQQPGTIKSIEVYYEGYPREAIRAPWDGGLSWKKDSNDNHFIATSCQGLGASVWWPAKDHMYDEVDSMSISVEVPERLTNVSNGRLKSVDRNKDKKTRTFHWFVSNPINNYGVNINIGDYTSWNEVYEGENGKLDVTYWALKADERAAKKQFEEVPRMLKAFEHWFGPYPFYEDGYQLVQVPYLGMEHQSSITYGNEFQNGYLGRDLSGTGWGLKFDFIIVHESGHEWFANNLTHEDMADMWLHESFTNYSESLFLEYYFGKQAGQEYIRGTRANIQNQKPMIGKYGINDEGYPIDVYYKGSNILNTLRTLVNDDEKWRGLLRGLGEEFYHQTTNSQEVEAYISKYLRMDLEGFFAQYLRDPRVPTFEYYFKEGELHYRWMNTVPVFDMPLDLKFGDETLRIVPFTEWKSLPTTKTKFEVDPNFYISILKDR